MAKAKSKSVQLVYLTCKRAEENEVYAEGFIIGELGNKKKLKVFESFPKMYATLSDECKGAVENDLYELTMSEEGVATLSDIDIDDKSTDGAKTISTAMKIVDCIEQIKANHKYAPNEGYTMRFEDAPLSVCKKCGVVTYISELEDNLCGSCR